ncbi:DUF3224 domain-containing protein [Flindersiella endophytica]
MNKTMRASGVITVHTYQPQDLDKSDDGMDVVMIHVEETFSGDIEGEGVATFLQAGRADGSASFVGLERVHGMVAGKQGTFLLQDSGTVEGQVVNGEWFVVPGSGTGDLIGLRGTGGLHAKLGESAHIHLDHWFE